MDQGTSESLGNSTGGNFLSWKESTVLDTVRRTPPHLSLENEFLLFWLMWLPQRPAGEIRSALHAPYTSLPSSFSLSPPNTWHLHPSFPYPNTSYIWIPSYLLQQRFHSPPQITQHHLPMVHAHGICPWHGSALHLPPQPRTAPWHHGSKDSCQEWRRKWTCVTALCQNCQWRSLTCLNQHAAVYLAKLCQPQQVVQRVPVAAVFESGPGMWARHTVPWSSPRVGLVFIKTATHYKKTVTGL